MAKDKNSFVAYTDWNKTFEKLSDDEAGRLAKMMFSFVSDENPEAPDRITELLFEPIKNQLERDLEKYKEVRQKRSESGRNGGLRSGESRSKTEQNEANTTNINQNEANASKTKQNEAVNVNVIVNDNDILLVKESKLKEVWQIFPGKRNSFEKDLSNFLKKSEGVEVDFEKMLSSAKKAPNVYFQTWVNDFVPKSSFLAPEENLEMPDDFREIWDEWKQYRKDKRIKAYAAVKWEQIAVDKLLELSNKDPVIAKLILKQTYENSYQGFFPLKQEFNNGKSNNQSGATGNNPPPKQATFNIQEAAGRLAEDFAKGNIPGVY